MSQAFCGNREATLALIEKAIALEAQWQTDFFGLNSSSSSLSATPATVIKKILKDPFGAPTSDWKILADTYSGSIQFSLDNFLTEEPYVDLFIRTKKSCEKLCSSFAFFVSEPSMARVEKSTGDEINAHKNSFETLFSSAKSLIIVAAELLGLMQKHLLLLVKNKSSPNSTLTRTNSVSLSEHLLHKRLIDDILSCVQMILVASSNRDRLKSVMAGLSMASSTSYKPCTGEAFDSPNNFCSILECFLHLLIAEKICTDSNNGQNVSVLSDEADKENVEVCGGYFLTSSQIRSMESGLPFFPIAAKVLCTRNARYSVAATTCPTVLALLNNFANCSHALFASAGSRILEVNTKRELHEKPSISFTGVRYNHSQNIHSSQSAANNTPFRTPMATNSSQHHQNTEVGFQPQQSRTPEEVLMSEPCPLTLSTVQMVDTEITLDRQPLSLELVFATSLISLISKVVLPFVTPQLKAKHSSSKEERYLELKWLAHSTTLTKPFASLSSRLAMCMSLLERIAFIIASDEKDMNGLGFDCISKVYGCLQKLWAARGDYVNYPSHQSFDPLKDLHQGNLSQSMLPALMAQAALRSSQEEVDTVPTTSFGNLDLFESTCKFATEFQSLMSNDIKQEKLRKLMKRFVREKVLCLGSAPIHAKTFDRIELGDHSNKSNKQYASLEAFGNSTQMRRTQLNQPSPSPFADHTAPPAAFTHTDVLTATLLVRLATTLLCERRHELNTLSHTHDHWFTQKCAPLLIAILQPLVSNISFIGINNFFSLARCGITTASSQVVRTTSGGFVATPLGCVTPSTTPSSNVKTITPSLSQGPSVEALKFALVQLRREFLCTIQATQIALNVFIAKKESALSYSLPIVRLFGDVVRELKNEATKAMFDSFIWLECLLPLMMVICGLWVGNDATREDAAYKVHASWIENALVCQKWLGSRSSFLSDNSLHNGINSSKSMFRILAELYGPSRFFFTSLLSSDRIFSPFRRSTGRLSTMMDSSPLGLQRDYIRRAFNSTVRPSAGDQSASPLRQADDKRRLNSSDRGDKSLVVPYPFRVLNFVTVEMKDGRSGLLLSVYESEEDANNGTFVWDFARQGQCVLLQPCKNSSEDMSLQVIVNDIRLAAQETSSTLFSLSSSSLSPSPVPCRSPAASPLPQTKDGLFPSTPISPRLPSLTPLRRETHGQATPNSQCFSKSPARVDENRNCFSHFDKKLQTILSRLSVYAADNNKTISHGLIPRVCDVLPKAPTTPQSLSESLDLFSSIGELVFLPPYLDEDLKQSLELASTHMVDEVLLHLDIDKEYDVDDNNAGFLGVDTTTEELLNVRATLTRFFNCIFSAVPHLSPTARRLMSGLGEAAQTSSLSNNDEPTGGGKGFPVKVVEAMLAATLGLSSSVSPSTSRCPSPAPVFSLNETDAFQNCGVCPEISEMVAKPIFEEICASLRGAISMVTRYVHQKVSLGRGQTAPPAIQGVESVVRSTLQDFLVNGLLTYCRNHSISDVLAIPRAHLFLSFELSPSLQIIPWEVLDVTYGHSISRIPSIRWLAEKINQTSSQYRASTESKPSDVQSLADILDFAGLKCTSKEGVKLDENNGSIKQTPSSVSPLCIAPLAKNRISYLLDPEGNLPGTRRRFQEFFEGNKIEGTIGPLSTSRGFPTSEAYADYWLSDVMPRLSEIHQSAESSAPTRDEVGVFIFMGHGHGRAFLPPSRISQIIGQITVTSTLKWSRPMISTPKAPVMALMGCSSANITLPTMREVMIAESEDDTSVEPNRFLSFQTHNIKSINVPTTSPHSVVHTYLALGSPAVVGCTWTVTDHQIDRLALQMLSGTFGIEGTESKTENHKSKPSSKSIPLCSSLAEALAIAKRKAKFRYALAGAAVLYGLPMHTIKGAAEMLKCQGSKEKELQPLASQPTDNKTFTLEREVFDVDDEFGNNKAMFCMPHSQSNGELSNCNKGRSVSPACSIPTTTIFAGGGASYGCTSPPMDEGAVGRPTMAFGPLDDEPTIIASKRARETSQADCSPLLIGNVDDDEDEVPIGTFLKSDVTEGEPRTKCARKEKKSPSTTQSRILNSPQLRSLSRQRSNKTPLHL